MWQSPLPGHEQTEARTAATGEEEATGGEAASQGPGGQGQPQGQWQERGGRRRPGHLGEDLRGSQHLTGRLGVARSEWKVEGCVPGFPVRPSFYRTKLNSQNHSLS